MRVTIAVLLGLLLVRCDVRYDPAIRHHQETECLSNLSMIGKFLLALDAKGRLEYPGGADFLLQISKHLKPNQMKVFRCPADPDRETTRCSYRAVRAEVAEAAWHTRGARIIACCACGDDGDEPWHERGLVVLFNDGSTGFIEWKNMEGSDGGPIRVGPGSPDPHFRDLVR